MAPVDQFLQDLSASGIVADDRLAAVRAEAPPAADVDELARELVRQGLLTRYQAKNAVRGRAARLILGNYMLLEPIGQGAMGRVFKAMHRRMRRVVALKILTVPAGRDEAKRRRRFLREAVATAGLDHPNVVTAYDMGESGRVMFLAMQFVDGCDLRELIRREGPLPLERAADLVCQAAAGLRCAHDRGAVHRDVKPSNLMIDSSGTVKVLDLGLARLEEEENDHGMTRVGTILGTVDWMAPELAADAHTADRRADIYGLGCTLFFLLTGRPVYPGQSPVETLAFHREAPIPSLRDFRPDVPEAVDRLFRSMVAKHPGDRPPSMRAVEAALRPFRRPWVTPPRGAGSEGISSRPPSDYDDDAVRFDLGAMISTPRPRPASSWRDALPLLVAAAAGLAAVVAWLLLAALAG